MPIYWLGGARAADDYEDFYDGSWDDEANDKDESGANGPNTSLLANFPLTGCDDHGTESSAGTITRGLGALVRVHVGRPNSIGGGPIGSLYSVHPSDTRPFYGLSEVFQVTSSDATLSGLEVEDDVGTQIPLAPAFAPGTLSYTAAAVNGADEITIIPTVNDGEATYEIQDQRGRALVDADPNEDEFQFALSEVAETIKVKVTAQDTVITQTYKVLVMPPPNEIPNTWSLVPAGLATGDRFRLLFLSSTKRNGTSSDIADYNTFIQNRAAAGHADIRTHSSGFRVVGCTETVDARDNTGSTYTNSDKGVPIYWLGGAKAADDYEDFYDGSWDDEVNDKDESGANGPNTSQEANHPITGCKHNGTEDIFSGISLALSNIAVRVGRPNSGSSGNGPISNTIDTASRNDNRPLYGLSEVFPGGQLHRRDAERSGAEGRGRHDSQPGSRVHHCQEVLHGVGRQFY